MGNVVGEGWIKNADDIVADMHANLLNLSSDLTAWDRTQFGNVRAEIQKLKRELQSLRMIPGRYTPTHAEVKITDMLVELFHREEILWRQRARLEWLAHEDKNTYFFHLRASRRRRKNQIKALQLPNGTVTENTVELEEMMITDKYRGLEQFSRVECSTQIY